MYFVSGPGIVTDVLHPVSEQSAAWPYCLADGLQVIFVLTTMIHKRCLVLYEPCMANWMKGQKSEAASCSVRSRRERSL